MYKIKVAASFSAAHSLTGYQGDCCNLHGHNWKVMITVLCHKQDELGMAIDFRKAKEILNTVMQEFDHKHLNSLECFSSVNPTSEALARAIYQRLQHPFEELGGRLQEIELWESDNASVVYYE